MDIEIIKPIKIFTADRHTLSRNGLKISLACKELLIIGEGSYINEVDWILKENIPDILLTSHLLYHGGNEIDAIEFLPSIKENYPSLPILMVTMACLKEDLIKYLPYIDGMIGKDAVGEEIKRAIFSIIIEKKHYYRPQYLSPAEKEIRQKKYEEYLARKKKTT